MVIFRPSMQNLELCALALFRWGGVSSASDRGIGLALQGVGDDVTEDLCGSRVALVLQADAHLVSIDSRGSGVALHLHAAADVISVHGDGRGVTGNLQAAFDGVARTGWRAGADEDGSAAALKHQATGDRAAADLVRSGASGQARDGEVSVDGGGWTDGEGAAGDGDAASDGGALKTRLPPVLVTVPVVPPARKIQFCPLLTVRLPLKVPL